MLIITTFLIFSRTARVGLQEMLGQFKSVIIFVGHLLPGRKFDRILVSRSLLEDDPNKKDIALKSVAIRKDLAIQGSVDEQEQHWEHYWEMPEDERDLSDHLPVIATFEVR